MYKHYTVKILPEAEKAIKNELLYSQRNWGAVHAKKYREEINTIIQKLKQNPFQYSLKPEYGNGVRAVRQKGNYLLYYYSESRNIVYIMGFPSIDENRHLLKLISEGCETWSSCAPMLTYLKYGLSFGARNTTFPAPHKSVSEDV